MNGGAFLSYGSTAITVGVFEFFAALFDIPMTIGAGIVLFFIGLILTLIGAHKETKQA